MKGFKASVTDRSAIALTGIVMATEPARCIQIRAWLQARHPALTLHIANDERALRHALIAGDIDFVAIVAPGGSDSLPNALRRVVHVHTLVLVEAGTIGPLPDWLYCGADAVCSLQHTDPLRQALDDLVRICTLRRRLILLRAPGTRQSAMLRGLMSAQSAAPAVTGSRSRLTLRTQFANTTHPLIDDTGHIDLPALRSWQARSRPDAARPATVERHRRLASAAAETRQRVMTLAEKRSVIHERRELKDTTLSRVTSQAVQIGAGYDPATRLRLEQRVSALLQANSQAQACAAMHVQLAGIDPAPTSSRANSRLELGMLRATERLRDHFTASTLLERPSPNALVLLQPGDRAFVPGFSAPQVRLLLGSLGGLIRSSAELRIHTLTVAALALSASELIAWLDEI